MVLARPRAPPEGANQGSTMNDQEGNPAATGGLGNEADPASDPRYERYLEYCADMQEHALPCASFEEWLIQAEEGY